MSGQREETWIPCWGDVGRPRSDCPDNLPLCGCDTAEWMWTQPSRLPHHSSVMKASETFALSQSRGAASLMWGKKDPQRPVAHSSCQVPQTLDGAVWALVQPLSANREVGLYWRYAPENPKKNFERSIPPHQKHSTLLNVHSAHKKPANAWSVRCASTWAACACSFSHWQAS